MVKNIHFFQLRYFMALATHRSFVRAAEACFISQPALSQSIKSLEKEAGASLFYRRRTGVELTRSGRRFLAACREILERMERVARETVSDAERFSGRLAVGMPTSIGLYGFSSFLKSFLGRYPKIELIFRLQDTEVVLRQLLSMEVDFAVLPGPMRRPSVVSRELFRDRWALVGGARFLSSGRRRPRLRTLGRFPFLSLHESLGESNEVLNSVFSKHRVNPPVSIQADDMEILKRMALEDWGLAVLPRRMVLKDLKARRLQEVPIPEFRRPHSVFLVYRKDRALSKLDSELIRRLSRFYRGFQVSR